MLFSVFTPAHSATYLEDCYGSLLAQACQEWEWIVVPNGPLAEACGSWARDSRVRILSWQPGGNIGRLKRTACLAARGRWLVELDHDDLLGPQCLARLALVDAAFAYSDCGLFGDGLAPYRADLGWVHYPTTIHGITALAHAAFPVTARSLCQIFYAPDHVRAWQRRCYYRLGGHAPFPLADDLDLMCRTYLAGEEFQHLGGCHYLYRVHGGNSWLADNRRLQRWHTRVGRYWRPRLIREWCRRHGLSIDSGSQCGWVRRRVRRWDEAIPLARSLWGSLAPGGWLSLEAQSGEPPTAAMQELGYQVVDWSAQRLCLWRWQEGGPGPRPKGWRG